MTATMVRVPELPELTFEEKRHIYRLDGVQIPSVSKLMEPLKASCYAGVSNRTLENAAKKGTSVHNSIENWLKFGIEDIPAEHRGYYNGFREWWGRHKAAEGRPRMKTPIDIVRGQIVDYDPRTQRLKIEAFYPDWPIMVKRGYRECNVQLIDSRPLSDRQGKAIRPDDRAEGGGMMKDWRGMTAEE